MFSKLPIMNHMEGSPKREQRVSKMVQVICSSYIICFGVPICYVTFHLFWLNHQIALTLISSIQYSIL